MTKLDALNTLTNETRTALLMALTELENENIFYFIIEAGRSLLTQCLYALQGRLDGIEQSDLEWACQQAKIRQPDKQKITWTLRSNHLSGQAVDIMPIKDGKIDYSNQDERIVTVMKKAGFIWGGDWEGARRDPPHFELRK